MSTATPRSTRVRAAGLVGLLGTLTILTAGCDGGGATSPGGTYPARLDFVTSFQTTTGGGEGDAYDKANFVHVQVVSQGKVLYDEILPFEPSGVTQVPISVEIEGQTQAALDVTLLQDASALFTGTASLTLVPNNVAVADLTLVPVAASLSVPDVLPPLTSQGQTRPLSGDVLFATGDVASSLRLDWTSLTPSVVAVQTSGSTSSVVAVAPGAGLLRASSGQLSKNVQITVRIVVASVDVTPATPSISLGETVQLSATALDSLGSAISGKAMTWSSGDPSVASVTQDGLVKGVGGGTVDVSATTDNVTGKASVTVVAPPPDVQTGSATYVGVYSATVTGSVTPNLTPTTVWVEYGTDPGLSTFSKTNPVDIGSGDTPQSVSIPVVNLPPATTHYYRVAASNEGGTTQGNIQSFTTLSLNPPAVQTLSPPAVTTTAATLAGSVNPQGAPTSAWFEWSSSPDLSGSVATPAQDVGSGVAPQQITGDIGNLDPDGASFYYRVGASNAGGTAYGDIVSFVTAPTAPSGLSGSYDGAVYLRWTDNSSSETGFQVERSTSSSGGFSAVTSAPANSPYASDSGPFPAAVLYYRVRACNGSECSAPSNVLGVKVPPPTINGSVEYCPPLANCLPLSSFTVTLSGPVNATDSTDAYGFYSFPNLLPGTYSVEAQSYANLCTAIYKANPVSTTVGWGEQAQVDFVADSVICSGLSPDDAPLNSLPWLDKMERRRPVPR